MRLVFICLLGTLLGISGCSGFRFPGVHRVEVQQGNIIDQEMIDKLKPGMTKSQVRFVLGTPLLADTFHQDRWDYYYSKLDSDGNETREQVTVFFDADEKLTGLSGDYLPGSAAP